MYKLKNVYLGLHMNAVKNTFTDIHVHVLEIYVYMFAKYEISVIKHVASSCGQRRQQQRTMENS